MTGFVCRLIEAWAQLYTLGLSSEQRRERIDLVRADVADQAADAATQRHSAALPLLGRCLRGLPADLTWRLFDAPHPSSFHAEPELGGGPVMSDRASNLPLLSIACGVAWAGVSVLAIVPVQHSLAYAGTILAAIALAAWTIDLRRPGDEAAPSASPLLLALGIVAIAGGAVFDGGRLGLALLLPLAFGLSVAVLRTLAAARAAQSEITPQPLRSVELAAQAARGAAIAIEAPANAGLTRRALLRGSFGLGLASTLAAMGGVFVDFLWQRNVAGFGGIVTAGLASDFPPGTKTKVREGKFWLVNLTEEQGGPGYLALWQKCPHLGCVVPWLPRFAWPDPKTGERTSGWFRCPCHQSTYDHAGVRVYGPAPRSMDRMALRVTEDGVIEVDTGDISKGTDDNAAYVVRPSLLRVE